MRPATVETYDDHRIAMSFAVTGLKLAGVKIKDPGCVAKTFPDFFDRVAALRAGA
jgi:3-phosphoshikimate 1-carboxyvinyltransferase